jgi:purine-binding chemotaxis protein CheW
MAQALGQLRSVCIFRRGGEHFGFPVLHVQEMLSVRDITVVPRMPSYLVGLTNLRGEALPIVLLDRFIGLEERQTDTNYLVVLNIDHALLGIPVDGVLAVAKVPDEGLIQPEDVEDKACSGLFHFEGKLVTVLDTPTLLHAIMEDLAKTGCFANAKTN